MIWQDRADQYHKDEEQVLSSKTTRCICEPAKTVDGEISLLTFKTPMKESSGLLKGIFQISFVLEQNSFPEIAYLINHLKILNSHSTTHFLQSLPNQDIMQRLSKREQECVHHLARHLTYKEIAKELDISPRTVEVHIKHIKNKLGCYNLSGILNKVFEQKKLVRH